MSRADHFTIGLLQHASPIGATREEIHVTFAAMAREAAGRGAELIVSQELFGGYYFCQQEDAALLDLAEPIPGPTTQFAASLARELGVEITVSLFEKRAPGLCHNTSVYLGRDGSILGSYRKMHIPDDPRFFEKFYFAPGDRGWQVVDGVAKTGMLVCWDQWYPEAARLTALQGAELIVYPTAIGWYHGETPDDCAQQRDAWITMHRAHAIANGCWVAAANRIGMEADLTFWGSSMVIDPGGVIVAEASQDQPAVLVHRCDRARIEDIRRGWPFLRDRRVDAYGGITSRMLDGTSA
ncbi:MAG: carbon-nitrogen hydrolase [Planctomycetota bacterium]|nr:carbon-nitrogen hydrolase [Planctomycetota bacterium]MDA1106232.1 carbon-nitrogen hydrolase [Planctomycetota bacterium]